MKFFKNLLNLFGLFTKKYMYFLIGPLILSLSGAIYFPLSILFKESSIFKKDPSSTSILLAAGFIFLSIILIVGMNKAMPSKNPIILFRDKLWKAIRIMSLFPDIHMTDTEVSLLSNLKTRAQLKRTMQDVDKLLEAVDGLAKLVNLRKELQRLKDQRDMFKKLPNLIEEKQEELEKAEVKAFNESLTN